jgi:phosphoribosylglycinamide formyltransferase-1
VTVPVAVFASGRGSNFAALLRAQAHGSLGGGRIVLLCSDKPDCNAVAIAHAAEVAVIARTFAGCGGRENWEMLVRSELQRHGVRLIVLAGYMRLLGAELVRAYAGRIVNVHPSLLPRFPGLDAIGQALRAGVMETGVTVHYVDEGLDTGPVIWQERVPVAPGDTEASLAERIHETEHRLLPQVVAQLCSRMEGSDDASAGERIE